MLILPAIDMKGGKPVRLVQGDMARATVYGDDLVAMATRWEAAGAEYLHLVDLDGATQGSPVHRDAVRNIVAAVAIPCEIGGGIRTRADVEAYLDAGVDRVILGTSALADFALFTEVCRMAPEQIVVGIDARDGKVAVKGWVETTTTNALELATRCAEAGAAAIIFTDIARDGVMHGPAVESTRALARAVSVPVIASGGITSVADVRAIAALASDGVTGMIIGRALYEGTLTLADALAAAR